MTRAHRQLPDRLRKAGIHYTGMKQHGDIVRVFFHTFAGLGSIEVAADPEPGWIEDAIDRASDVYSTDFNDDDPL